MTIVVYLAICLSIMGTAMSSPAPMEEQSLNDMLLAAAKNQLKMEEPKYVTAIDHLHLYNDCMLLLLQQ